MARGAAGPAAPGSGGHGHTTGVTGGPGTPPVRGAGGRPGRRVPPVRLRHGQRADAHRLGDEQLRRGASSRWRERRSPSRRSSGGCASGRRRWPWSSGSPPSTWPPAAAPVSASARRPRDRAGRTLASPDVATCADCLRELADPADRRHRHPFITCTNCGPRFTIIDVAALRPGDDHHGAVPDVRRLCPRVRRSGRPALPRPADRLPRLRAARCELVDAAGGRTAREEALSGARALLAAGGVLAVKGLGGYHLACDASRERPWRRCAAASGVVPSRSR